MVISNLLEVATKKKVILIQSVTYLIVRTTLIITKHEEKSQKNDAELIVTVRTHWTAMVRIVDGIDTTTKKAVHNGAVGLS